jgi:hypothetical protein
MIELLLDKNLIIQKSNDIFVKILKPQRVKVVLKSSEQYEGLGDGYYTAIQQDDKIKLFYRACNIPNFNVSHEYGREFEYTCYAESNNGLDFTKPNINQNTNILFKSGCCHNFFPFATPSNQLLAIGGTQHNTGGLLLLGLQGNKWGIIGKMLDGSQLLPGWNHDNHFDSHNVMFYDTNANHYKIYLRDNRPHLRHVQYTTTNDFKTFGKFKNINILNYFDHIYNCGIFCYPESKYYIGFPSAHVQENANKKGMLMFSTNGHDWEVIDENVCQDITVSYMIAHGIIIDKTNNKSYIYVREIYEKELIAYSYQLNRIQEIGCKECGSIKLGPFDLRKSQEIFTNYKTNPNGFIQFELLDPDNNTVLISEKMYGDEYFNSIKWSDNTSIPVDSQYFINVILSDASLFSFKM